MSKKVSITLDDGIVAFIDQIAGNRSRFINDVLWKEKQRIFFQELADAYEEQSHDPEFKKEVAAWDVAAGDGLNA